MLGLQLFETMEQAVRGETMSLLQTRGLMPLV
jgi:hypothetical protein